MAAGTCHSCGQPIVWALTERRKSMPMSGTRGADGKTEPTVFEDGNLAPTGRTAFGALGDQVPVVKVLRAGEGRWKSHFADCPNAEQHRRRRRG